MSTQNIVGQKAEMYAGLKEDWAEGRIIEVDGEYVVIKTDEEKELIGNIWELVD